MKSTCSNKLSAHIYNILLVLTNILRCNIANYYYSFTVHVLKSQVLGRNDRFLFACDKRCHVFVAFFFKIARGISYCLKQKFCTIRMKITMKLEVGYSSSIRIMSALLIYMHVLGCCDA